MYVEEFFRLVVHLDERCGELSELNADMMLAFFKDGFLPVEGCDQIAGTEILELRLHDVCAAHEELTPSAIIIAVLEFATTADPTRRPIVHGVELFCSPPESMRLCLWYCKSAASKQDTADFEAELAGCMLLQPLEFSRFSSTRDIRHTPRSTHNIEQLPSSNAIQDLKVLPWPFVSQLECS